MPAASASSRNPSSPCAQYRFVPAMIAGRSASRSSAIARSSIRASGTVGACGTRSAGSGSSASMNT